MMEQADLQVKKLVINFLANELEISDETARLKAICQKIGAIPWGEARDIETVLTENKGTCTGKHKALEMTLDIVGIPYRSIVAQFKWSEQGLALPEELNKLLHAEDGEWKHGHNYVQLYPGTEEALDVDITWDPGLAHLGFKPLPLDWNGKTSFHGCQEIQRWEGVSIDEKKSELIGALSESQTRRRAAFLQELFTWTAAQRS